MPLSACGAVSCSSLLQFSRAISSPSEAVSTLIGVFSFAAPVLYNSAPCYGVLAGFSALRFGFVGMLDLSFFAASLITNVLSRKLSVMAISVSSSRGFGRQPRCAAALRRCGAAALPASVKTASASFSSLLIFHSQPTRLASQRSRSPDRLQAAQMRDRRPCVSPLPLGRAARRSARRQRVLIARTLLTGF